MKLTTLFILLFLFNSTSFSQNGWIQQQSGVTQSLNSVHFTSTSQGLAVGHEGRIISTTDGGENWNIQAIVTNGILRTINFTNSNTGFTAGSPSNIYKTTNGGTTWDTTGNTILYNWFQIFYCTNLVGYAVGALHNFNGWRILKTINGGNSWMISDTSSGSLSSMYFVDQNTGWVAGTSLLKTTNGGINWLTQPTGSTENWSTVFFTSSNTGWVASGTASILKTTNGGNTWNPQASSTNRSLVSMYFSNVNTGWIVGYGGTVINTTNSGVNWVNQPTGITARLNSIQFIAPTIGFVVGDSGKILKTTNGGNPIGIIQISDIVPEVFHITQNYPNPFNPQTKIKFAVPKASFTKLIIYDLLGREVATLVNEELRPGTYEADWDASSFSSGVYFYKIISGEFVETKKMVLMK